MRNLIASLLLVLATNFVAASLVWGQTHSATLVWTDTANPAGTTYNVYRQTGACPATQPATTTGFTKLNASPITVKTYTDTTVMGSATYCFIATAVSSGSESAPSGDAAGVIPGAFSPTMLQVTTTQ